MSMLAALDAVRVCERRSVVSGDPSAWARPTPTTRPAAARPAAARPSPAPYSWWSLARNPHAALISAVVAAAVAGDAALRRLR